MDESWLEELPALVRAAAHGDDPAVETLLASGSDPNEADADGWSALHAAATRDHVHVVRLLPAAGANVDGRSQGGFTPLLNARRRGTESSLCYWKPEQTRLLRSSPLGGVL